MRITRVRIDRFGPFRDRELELAPGLTVVHGPNEAGKSTWHAALLAALCGQRRGRGKPRQPEADFTRRHRPWDASEWRVACDVELADGRRATITQDLGGGLRNAVHDPLGRDVSGEILHDGAPDGARWLGLERDAFRATAWVPQGDILAVRDQADALQAFLQRAAATHRADSTVAEAVERIQRFHGDHVGLDRANARKPLRAAIDGLDRARAVRTQAVDAHLLWLQASAEASEADDRRGAAAHHVRVVDAALAVRQHRELDERVATIDDLAARHPAPPSPVDDGALADQLAAALGAWEARPRPVIPPTGPTTSELAAELAGLPEPPAGDVEPHRSVVQAAEHVQQTRTRLAEHEHGEPPVPSDEVERIGGTEATDATPRAIAVLEHELAALPAVPVGDVVEHATVVDAALRLAGARQQLRAHADEEPATPPAPSSAHRTLVGAGLDATAIRQLAADLSAARPAPPPGPVAAPVPLVPARRPVGTWVGVGIAAIGLALLALGAPAVGIAALVVGVVVGVTATARHRVAQDRVVPPPIPTGAVAVDAADPGVAPPADRSAQARALLAELGVAADAVALLATADQVVEADRLDRTIAAWSARRAERTELVRAAEGTLREALVDRGAPVGERTDRALDDYRAACRSRAHQAAEAARRNDLVGRLDALRAAVEAADQRATEATARLEEARLRRARWEGRRDALAHDVVTALVALVTAIRSRGPEVGAPAPALPGSADATTPDGTSPVPTTRALDDATVSVQALLDHHLDACADRAAVAGHAARRPELLARLTARQESDAAAVEVERQRRGADDQLLTAARAAGIAPDDDPARIAAAVRAWQAQREERLASAHRAQVGWGRLQHLLDGRTPADWAADRDLAAAKATAAADRLDPAELDAVLELDLEAERDHRRAVLRIAEGHARELAGQATERGRSLPDVAAADEALAAAERELVRVRQLDATLATTARILREAEERINQDLGPQLATHVRTGLAQVTGGRYDDVLVDPADLAVRVRLADGSVREATSLSRGTVEQVYVLLRLAMAELLAHGDEPCPLFLDEATVHADAVRTGALLDLLLVLAADRQVVLFTQEDDVLAWARTHLRPEHDRLIELPAPLPIA